MKNALSIDVEDWFCVNNLKHSISRNDWGKCELRVEKSTVQLLRLLERYKAKATFFVLGWIVDRIPDLVREIENLGHEVASHGYHHEVLYEMTPESFDADLKRSLDAISSVTHQDVIGYRAPSFSLTQRTMWAVDIMVKNGIRYDSSIFPIGFHPDYGLADAKLEIHNISESLIEVPMSCVELFRWRIPCSGGGYFRVLPYSLSSLLIRTCNSQGRRVVFYLHPWEVDPGQPKVKLPLMKSFRHYSNLDKTLRRFERLLNDFEFTTIKEVVGL